jgi:endonuclease YncB( thermonuclease family)
MAASLTLAACNAAPGQPLTIKGPVTHVRDGDTIEVAGIPVRLNGVDAAELDTRMGGAARAFMVQLTQDQTVTCHLNGERSYDRRVGMCWVDGRDLGREMIRNGFALDCARFSHGRYAKDENPAVLTDQTRAPYCRAR